MRTIFKKIGLSLAAFACAICAGVGVAVSIPQSAKTAKADAVALSNSDFYISGAGVRLVNDANGAGIRFHTNLLASEYANVEESGTLIIPDFRYDGELTLEDLNNGEKSRPTHIVTKGTVDGKAVDYWRDFEVTGSTEKFKRATVYLYDIPEVGYGTRMVAVSYVKIDGAYHYTSIIDGSNYISLSDVATRVINGTNDTSLQDRLTSFVVDTVKVTYVMPDGSKQTEEVAYGETLQGPSFEADGYVINGLTDQYGKAVNLNTYKATTPVTITVDLGLAQNETTITTQIVKDAYAATAPERAFINGSTGTTVTEGVPAGYGGSALRLDWYQDSTSLWKAGGNPFYRNCYNQNDISGYNSARFAIKLETSGDACIQIYPKQTSRNQEGVVRNEWLGIELVQTSTNLWTLTITNLDKGEVIATYENVVRNNNGLNDVDSVASLVFSACKWDNVSPSLMLQPCTSTDMTASIYTTPLFVYKDKSVPSVDATEIDDTAFCDWAYGVNNNLIAALPEIVDDVEAPDGFNKVSKITSSTGWTSSSRTSDFFSTLDITNYSEVWAAYKSVNGHFTQTMPSWTDINGNNEDTWIYFHFTQTGETTDSGYLLWDIEIIKNGTVWGTMEDQHCNGELNNIQKLFNYDADNGRIVQYHSGSGTAEFYATELRGILKDGVAEDTDKTIEIPENAVTVRQYPWKQDRFTDGKNEILTGVAPEGYSLVLKHTWSASRTSEYTYCFDTTIDITQYSDLYFATKIENGTRIYIANSGGHYEGKDGWLYAHYNQVSAGVWQPTFASEDGYYVAPTSTISATDIRTLVDGKLYGVGTAGNGTITYWTEVLGVPKTETEAWGERVIWSAVEGSKVSDMNLVLPEGFSSSLRVKEGFTKSDFAALDLSNTIYQELRFGMLATANINFASGYQLTKDGAEVATTLCSRVDSWDQMNVVTLTKAANGWNVMIEGQRWGGDGVGFTTTPFTATVAGNSLAEIFSTIFNTGGTITMYVTEVRGTHECRFEEWVSNGDGTLSQVCVCGKKGETKDFEHGIPEEVEKVRESIWRENNYALSASTTEAAPVGFTNVKEYKWNHNTVLVEVDGNKIPWGSNAKDMPLTCLDQAVVSEYTDVYFAIKLVGGEGIYVGSAAKYKGGDWLYAHYAKQLDGTWNLSVASPDGYAYENIQRGLTGTKLQELMAWKNLDSISTGLRGGFYPTKAVDDTTSDVRIYFTDMRAYSGCDGTHSVTRIVSNEDGTHNEVCSACGEVVAENVACAGGEATCTAGATCSACGYVYEAAKGHNYSWNIGKYVCSVCGDVGDTAETVAASAVIDSSNAHLTLSSNAAGITAPAGFSTVTNFFSASGNTWGSKILAAVDYSSVKLSAFSEVWFAIKVVNGHFTQTAPTWTDIDSDSTSPWINFHFIQEDDGEWTIEITKDGVLWGTQTNQTGSSVGSILDTKTDDGRIVVYQKTDGTNSNADVNIYATEVLGVFETGISENATIVLDQVYNSYYFGENAGVVTSGVQTAPDAVWSNEAAPEGFTKTIEFDWEKKGLSYFNTGRLDNSKNLTAYSDLYIAVKFVNGQHIYVKDNTAGAHYAGGDWLYVHFEQVADGEWTYDVKSKDGYFASRNSSAANIPATTLAGLMNGYIYPHKGSVEGYAMVYFTELIGVLKCDGANHTADSIVSNGNGTHSVTCRCGVVVNASEACSGGKATCTQLAKCSTCGAEYGNYAAHVVASYVSNDNGTHNAVCKCGATVTANVACAGGEASCTEAAVCSFCKASYGEALGHSGAWDGDEYLCSGCGVSCGDVTTELTHQNIALFTDAETITANAETPATIDLSSATDLKITGVKSVTLDGVGYDATVSGSAVSFNVLPNKVFGEYLAKAIVDVEGKEIEITVPVTIVTNMITTNAGMLNMKYILRGKTDVEKAALEGQTEKDPVYQGGAGGVATMNGNGYYMLGADIQLQNDGGGYTDVYVWGTPTVPFVGTFDGNGYILKGYKKTNWFSGHTLEDLSVTTSYANELEGSLFGYVNGKVKNVAFTGAEFGIYANLVLDGTGVLEDVYVEIADLQNNGNVYVAPIFWRNGEASHGTLRNVVINVINQKMGATPSSQYPAIMRYITAENVSVYGFNKSWINANGRGNIYQAESGNDGSEAGVYVEYNDGATNEGAFWSWNLNANLWKIVNKLPYLMNVAVDGTAASPATTAPATITATDDNVVANGATEYCIVWSNGEAGSYSAVRLIREVMKKATGLTLPAGAYNEDESAKQIVVGTFAQYGDKVDLTGILSDDSYGVYVEGRTIYVLAENEETFVLAAENLCRQLFDLMESVNNVFTQGDFTNKTIEISSIKNYSTEITFNMRSGAFTNVTEEKYSMNMSPITPFTYFEEMHNTFNYFTDYQGGGTWKSTDSGQLCYFGRGVKTTFDAMVDHVVAKIVAKAVEVPSMTAINFMIEDNTSYCTCNYCKKFATDTVTTSITQLSFNTSVPQLIFLNAVANKLAANDMLKAAGRTIAVEFFAYGLYADAPIVVDESVLTEINNHFDVENETTTVTYSDGQTNKVLKAADNLRVWWTSHKANHSFRLTHDANEHMLQSLEGWIASVGAENVDVFMYQVAYQDYFMPLNTWQYQIEWYQDLAALGVNNYILNLGNEKNKAEAQTTFAAFKTYIDSRAMTDINVTFEQLKDEFFGVNGYYGAAGPMMRTYFEQLVSVMEGLKQTGALSGETYLSVNGYINPVQLIDYDNTSDTVRRQAFFNGHYGYDLVTVAFGGEKSSSSNITGADIFTYDGQTQTETLESWYTMCQEALKEVDANSVYAKRIQVEAVFPEYAFLVLESTYSTTAAWSSTNKTYSGDITSNRGASEVFKKTYQEFYNHVIALGFEKPAEGLNFNTGDAMTLDTMSTIKQGNIFNPGTYGIYKSMYKNWGVSF